MSTIQDQLALEEHMVDRGITRYHEGIASAEKRDHAHETSYGGVLMKNYVGTLSSEIQTFCEGRGRVGRLVKYRKVLEAVSPDKLAFLTLRKVFGCLIMPMPLQSICIGIGQMVEDEMRFTVFQQEHPDYYKTVLDDFNRKGTTSYRHMHRALSHMATQKSVPWEMWSRDFKFSVGAKLVEFVLDCTDLVTKVRTGPRGKSTISLHPTDEALEWVQSHKDFMELLYPDFMPCIVPPDDWTALDQGGYYGPKMRASCQFVKLRRSTPEHTELIRSADMPEVYNAVNTLQRTAWKVNNRVQAVMRDVWAGAKAVGMPRSDPYDIPTCPLGDGVKSSSLVEGSAELAQFLNWKAEAAAIYTLEKERVAKCLAVARTMRMATEFESRDKFWFVYNLDFRGRVYSVSTGLSPQGTDLAKGLLEFGEGKPLGETGLYWLMVHGANRYGYDKTDYDGRVQWVEDNKTAILRSATDPMGSTDFWGSADKPWQFLAFCFEYAEADFVGPGFVSRLPIAFDGSCNGLQNFSAMLRDHIGGAATNLVPSEEPADIYSEVGAVATRRLQGVAEKSDDYAKAQQWMKFFKDCCGANEMPRKMTKPPVMTMPYGSTRRTCTASIFKYILEAGPEYFGKHENFRMAVFLTPLVWDSIGDVVVAAREAMRWIQDCTSALSKEGHHLHWTSPLGMPIYQRTMEYETYQVETRIGGRLQLRLATDTDKLNVRKMRQASSPNLVHHADATHLMMTVNLAASRGIDSFACIHDDYGVHAADAGRFMTTIREAFVKLYTEHDLLESFKSEHEERTGVELPEVPASGLLDIERVRESAYFFG